MTKEDLRRAKEIDWILPKVENLITPDRLSNETAGECLKILFTNDNVFKRDFIHLVKNSKTRLEKEFQEL